MELVHIDESNKEKMIVLNKLSELEPLRSIADVAPKTGHLILRIKNYGEIDL